ELTVWADARYAEGFFIEPGQDVQETFQRVAHYANSRYPPANASAFLAKADPWLIAHAIIDAGRVVTFEERRPASSKPKIPDVCDNFGVVVINMWDLLRELGLRLTL